MYQQDEALMRRALELAQSAADRGNEPFGALLVRDGSIVMTQENQVNSLTDPTCHAEHGLLRLRQIEKKVLLVLADRLGQDFPFTGEERDFLSRHAKDLPTAL